MFQGKDILSQIIFVFDTKKVSNQSTRKSTETANENEIHCDGYTQGFVLIITCII